MLYPLKHRATCRTFTCMYIPCYIANAFYYMLYTKTSFGCIANLDFYITFENVIQHFPRCQALPDISADEVRQLSIEDGKQKICGPNFVCKGSSDGGVGP